MTTNRAALNGVIADQPYDLAVAAAAALSDADDEAERAALTVTSDLRPAPVSGDPVLLDRLVTNLVENAMRHNYRGGQVHVVTVRVHEGEGRPGVHAETA